MWVIVVVVVSRDSSPCLYLAADILCLCPPVDLLKNVIKGIIARVEQITPIVTPFSTILFSF